MKKLYLLILLILLSFHLISQNVTLSGTIIDASSGEALISANVYQAESQSGTTTNTYGFYSYTAPPGKWTLRYSYIGYQDSTVSLYVTKDTSVSIALSPTVDLEIVEVQADKVNRIEERTQMSSVRIPVQQINQIPALLGERDVLKALQLMPGVQSGGEGQAGLYVRGGSPDQNLILLDGVPVYNANHVFGFFSVFSTDAIKDVNLIKGGFPARYGGRLSSVLDIRLKEGNLKEIHGAVSVGLVAAKAMIEGPIGKSEKTSFLVAGRRTYIDALAAPFIPNDGFSDVDPTLYFYDLNAKVRHKIDDKNELFLSSYLGADAYGFAEDYRQDNFRSYTDVGLSWGNTTASLRWNRVWNNRLFSNLTLIYSNYNFQNGITDQTFNDQNQDEIEEETGLSYLSGIRDWGIKMDFDYLPHPNHSIKAGLALTYHQFNPGGFDLYSFTDPNVDIDTVIQQKKLSSWETAAYIEDDWTINSKLSMNVGLHLSSFHVQERDYFSFQPRIAARYLLPNRWSIKGSFATMRQYIQLLTNENLSLPTDLWLPSTARVRPQDSWQVALGIAKTLPRGYELSSEVYYKEMTNVLSFREGASLFAFSDWQDRVTQGNGQAYGWELLLQKKEGRLTGWIGYTLAWSWRQFDDINFGRKYPFRFDRRHDISVVAMYELTPKIRFSGTWVFGTGNAVTLAADQFLWLRESSNPDFTFPSIIDNFDEKNNYRAPNYHRLDLGVDFIKEKKYGTRTWSIGAYNAYSRANPFFIFSDTQFNNVTGESRNTIRQASLFPIIPYINFRYEF